MSSYEKAVGVILLLLPYIFLWASAVADPGYVTSENLPHQLTLYPYDFTIFHPGSVCYTCKLLKPARSKHCSICKRCITKFGTQLSYFVWCIWDPAQLPMLHQYVSGASLLELQRTT